ncbi:MAG: hypothetical protein ACOYZ8_06895 [Chloroflexota bacterium]
MEISPGVELVWSLASREAVLSRVRDVEPDHFFCALLKYAEFSNSDLGNLKVHSLVLFTLIAERDQLRSELKQSNLQTDIRKQIRSRLGQGSYQAKPDEILHRAEASRQLFAKAAERKRNDTTAAGRIDTVSLLQVLLEHPTRNMVEVLGVPSIRAVVASHEKVDSVLNKYAQELSPSQTAIGKKSISQVQVMAWAIQSLAKHPLMLICESGVDTKPLIWAALQKQHTPPKILSVDLEQASQQAKSDERFLSQVTGILEEISDKPETSLLLDAVKLADIANPLDSIQSSLSKKSIGLIVMVNPQAYAKAKEKSSSIDNPYRIIWLHDLERATLPAKV